MDDGVQVLRTRELSAPVLEEIRALLDDAFDGEFTDDDWDHTRGGWHCVVIDGGRVIAHAAVVPRTIHVGDRPLRCGYVEGVATTPAAQGRGHGTRAMEAATVIVRREFEIGVLSTDAHGFYERIGWQRWQGPSHVLEDGQRRRTEDEDDGLMAMAGTLDGALELTEAIACEARSGDAW